MAPRFALSRLVTLWLAKSLFKCLASVVLAHAWTRQVQPQQKIQKMLTSLAFERETRR